MTKTFEINITKTLIENNKFVGFIAETSNGDSQYMTIKDFQMYLKNKNKNLSVRFPNESVYQEITLNLDEFIISNEFQHEYFGWYNNTAIALKKPII